jgi:hypothetical protein
VDLSRQRLYQHFRSGVVDTHLVSTGDGIGRRHVLTRPGIFTIKSKSARHVSSIFHVMMFHWMPFDGGIGFHSLRGNTYYKNLGVKPSSAGCVRMSRESAGEVYEHSSVGTAVIVHRGNPARVLAFGNADDPSIRVMEEIDADLLARRLDVVAQGRPKHPLLQEKLALPPGMVFWQKIHVGELSAQAR